MPQNFNNNHDRIAVFTRLLVTLVCLLAYEILKIVVYACVIFQYVYLLIAGKHSEPLKLFSNKLSMYIYKILRYSTLNENKRPFPFGGLPTDKECERSADTIHFP